MRLFEEFKLYENMFKKVPLKEEASPDIAKIAAFLKANKLSGVSVEELKQALRLANEDSIPEIAYVIKTTDEDQPYGYDEVYLSWSNEYDDYTFVSYIEDISEADFHTSVSDAVSRAKDADSGMLGSYTMYVVKIANFKEAYLNGEEPIESVVQEVY